MKITPNFLETTLGKTGLHVHRLGLSASNRPGKKTIFKAIDQGITYFFAYGFDSQMISVLRDVFKNERQRYVIATGAYNLLFTHQNLTKTLEKRLKQLQTDYIDIFLFLGVTKPGHFPEHLQKELRGLKKTGKVRFVGMSCHDRRFAGKLVADGELDAYMIRYNAAHRGAAQDIFPHLAAHNPGVISYTATRWGYLTRRDKRWPKDRPIPSAGLCYRFVLSNPHVHVCMTAPSNEKQFKENMEDVQKGPLSEEEMSFMHAYGDMVYRSKKWFM
jgi:aryl-alcohol dehydrogenase-like predicted oxidoreductase